MVNGRLMWVLESKGLLASEQYCLRKNSSTEDHLVHFVNHIRNAFGKKKGHVIAIFFDLEKAYDVVEAQSIIRSLRP